MIQNYELADGNFYEADLTSRVMFTVLSERARPDDHDAHGRVHDAIVNGCRLLELNPGLEHSPALMFELVIKVGREITDITQDLAKKQLAGSSTAETGPAEEGPDPSPKTSISLPL